MEHVTHINTSHAIKFLHSLLVYVTYHEAFRFDIYVCEYYVNDVVHTIICVQIVCFSLHCHMETFTLSILNNLLKKEQKKNRPGNAKTFVHTTHRYFIINS